jgi:hypothetical protein
MYLVSGEGSEFVACVFRELYLCDKSAGTREEGTVCVHCGSAIHAVCVHSCCPIGIRVLTQCLGSRRSRDDKQVDDYFFANRMG